MIESINVQKCAWCSHADFPAFEKLPVSFFDQDNRCPEAMLLFMSVFTLDEIKKATGRFSAGCRFRLFLNGVFVDDGPVEVGGDYNNITPPNWWFYDEQDISAYLHPGENTVTIEVFPAGFTQMDYSDGHGWIFFELNCEWSTIYFPPEQWLCRRNSAFLDNQHYDARLEDKYLDWHPCVAAQDKTLFRLDIPPLTNIFHRYEKIILPYDGSKPHICVTPEEIIIDPVAPVAFYLQFKQELAAHFYMELEGTAHVRVELEFQELMGIRPATNPVETYISSCGHKHYRSIKMHAFRWVRVTVHPADFCSSEPLRPVRLLRVGAFSRGFPFSCKFELPPTAEKFKKIDVQCLDNLALCMQRMHLDSPIHQEGLGCTGDYRIEALMEYAALGEIRLAKADLIRTALLLRQKGKLFHTSYELSYIMMLYEYWKFSGDRQLVAELFDSVILILYHYDGFIGIDGLLSNAENYLFIDWKADGGFTYHHPPASRGTGCLTAFYYGALERCVSLAETSGNIPIARRCEQRMQKIKEQFQKLLWDEDKQLFRDGIPLMSMRESNLWLPADDGVISYTSQTNILALAYGLVSETGTGLSLLSRVITDQALLQPTPYFMHYLFEAVDRYNQWPQWGQQLLCRWNIFASEGLRESWYAGDYSHAWGGSPAYWLRRMKEL